MTTTLRYSMGVSAFDEGRYQEAIDHFEAVLADEPRSLAAREYLVRSYYHRAALPRAEQEARTILESDPTNEYMTLLLARSLERQSKHEEAASIRRRLAAMTGNEADLAYQP